MLFPVANHEKSEHHAAKVCDVRYAVARRGHRKEELNTGIENHEPFRLDGNRNRENEDALLGEGHTEGQQNGVDGTRGTHRGPMAQLCGIGLDDGCHAVLCDLIRGYHVELGKLRRLLEQSGSHAAGDIIKEEFLRSPHALHHAAKHPQCEHVEKEVVPPAMHKHVGEKLVDVEIGREEKVKSEHII